MDENKNKKGIVAIVSGPSGVGKSTICKEVARRISEVVVSVSFTTRPKSEMEVDGQDYRFISKDEFNRMIEEDSLLEYAEVFGNYYGTPKAKVRDQLECGKTVILEIDVQGAQHVKEIYPDAVMIFILPPRHKDLALRMSLRGREADKAAEERLNGAEFEIAAAWQYYDHMIINDDLEQAVEEVIQVIDRSIGDK